MDIQRRGIDSIILLIAKCCLVPTLRNINSFYIPLFNSISFPRSILPTHSLLVQFLAIVPRYSLSILTLNCQSQIKSIKSLITPMDLTARVLSKGVRRRINRKKQQKNSNTAGMAQNSYVVRPLLPSSALSPLIREGADLTGLYPLSILLSN